MSLVQHICRCVGASARSLGLGALCLGSAWAQQAGRPGSNALEQFPQPQTVSQTAPSPAEVLRLLEQAQVNLFKGASPAVVILEAELSQEALEAEADSNPDSGILRKGARSEGSGFVVRANGVLVTNQHVVAKAHRITARFRDGRRIEARVLGVDERTDVCVLQVDAEGLPVLSFADSDAASVGQAVYAIGVPFGQEWSFTAGMLSGKGRTRLLAPSSPIPLFEDYLQTDALINPGHSGGPLLDSSGRVLGMNTLITRSERGLAFAVPSNLLQQTIHQILEAGRVSRPWLGIRVESLGETAALAERLSGARYGAVVLAVEPDGPAFRTDLRPADVIQSIEGRAVASALELQRELFARKAGQSVKVGVWRQGVQKTILIPLAEISAAPQPVVEPGHAPKALVSAQERFGLKLREVKGRGVRIEGVENGGFADRSGFEPEDLVTEVENRPVRSAADCLQALRSGLGRNPGGVLVQVERHGRRTVVLLRVD